MTLGPLLRFLSVAVLVLPSCALASTLQITEPAALTEPVSSTLVPAESESSSLLPDAPGRDTAVIQSPSAAHFTEVVRTRAFSSFAMMLNVGTRGLGVEVATPLAQKVNLRAGASFFNYSPLISTDGFNVNGQVSIRNVAASVDFFPFGGSFRISPGVTFYNGNRLTATAATAPGQTFTLDDTDYTSSPADPVHGVFDITLGKKFGPSLTAGFGNMLPRRAGRHWSMPSEFGFVYVGAPTVSFNLTGTACQAGSTDPDACGSVTTDPQTQANLQAEQNSLKQSISGLRFYPIVSTGLSYKF